jgi:IS1 family transposase
MAHCILWSHSGHKTQKTRTWTAWTQISKHSIGCLFLKPKINLGNSG